ncbi:MAG: hypothetical protein DMF38_05695 [Verrucomicrobia bacterium]|nr:MAG: hypothetical protein DME78_06945 [Verrucomicrobiota bacterium]PYL35302.1 MAG: hypothetical protein DMF38_05695 [Verrucomicrobiota bacterium]
MFRFAQHDRRRSGWRRSLHHLPTGGTGGGFGGNGSGGGLGVGGVGFGGDGVSGIGIPLENRLYCSHLP